MSVTTHENCHLGTVFLTARPCEKPSFWTLNHHFLGYVPSQPPVLTDSTCVSEWSLEKECVWPSYGNTIPNSTHREIIHWLDQQESPQKGGIWTGKESKEFCSSYDWLQWSSNRVVWTTGWSPSSESQAIPPALLEWGEVYWMENRTSHQLS